MPAHIDTSPGHASARPKKFYQQLYFQVLLGVGLGILLGYLHPDLAAAFAGRFTFFQAPHTHILCYLIPGPDGSLTPGQRRLNWVWYLNAAPGDELDVAPMLNWALSHNGPASLRYPKTNLEKVERGVAPITAIERGANSGRRSMAGATGDAGSSVEVIRSADDGGDATLLEGPGDDDPLDLGRPLPDPVHAQLAEEPLGDVRAHVAAPP